jgi:glycosyltransferase involved in cell wall biosynthesis
MNDAKFSIVLPIRNSGKYIEECVNSILSQTFKDFELLILAHDSDQDTMNYLNSFNHPKTKIFYAENINGIVGNWARIKDIPKSKYMTIIGYDDILAPNFLEVINTLIEQHPNATLYHTHFNFIDGAGNLIRPAKQMPEELQVHEFLKLFLINSIDSMGTGYVMRSADYNKVGGISIQYPNLLFADFDLWIKMIALGYKVVSKENCFSFRLHQSVTATTDDTKLHKGLEVFFDFLLKLKTNDKKSGAIIDEFGADFLMKNLISYSHRILRTPKNKRNISIRKFIGQTKMLAQKIGVEKQYYPEKNKQIRLSIIIDESVILSTLFFTTRKIYGKPFRH